MFRFYTLGFISLIAGAFLMIFQGIASVATAGKAVWKSYAIVDFVSAEYLTWIDAISWDTAQRALHMVVAAPIDRVLLGFAAICFLLGFITKR